MDVKSFLLSSIVGFPASCFVTSIVAAAFFLSHRLGFPQFALLRQILSSLAANREADGRGGRSHQVPNTPKTGGFEEVQRSAEETLGLALCVLLSGTGFMSPSGILKWGPLPITRVRHTVSFSAFCALSKSI
ncbi:unnamed protein product [Vitrella brassicaformis CCMP3155]|uniref:Uncharacterized protein n=1 Tax=Vitrella brassicaformis (strain CCMP3155) TaxID=1169540 RepID=A0A0G4GPD9_VITBC|nr:unnamed protein product [Vitrella brassicaformis CCMP3155]|eukprot:CEM32250.1 unnamed protein product [Vitrella brassicaformis CCMP3155]